MLRGSNSFSKIGEMTLKRTDNVLILVDDLKAAKAFFIELGFNLKGQVTLKGL